MIQHYNFSIIRNGKEISLTDDEIFGAYRAFEKKNNEEYLQSILAEREITVNEDLFFQLLSDYEHLTSKGFDEQYALTRALELYLNQ